MARTTGGTTEVAESVGFAPVDLDGEAVALAVGSRDERRITLLQTP